MNRKPRPTYTLERQLYRRGFTFVAGIDEVGRGPLAGPVVAACVAFLRAPRIRGLADSKALTPRQRERLERTIKQRAACWAIASVTPRIIDRENILGATRRAMQMAVRKLQRQPDVLLVDGSAITVNRRVFQYAIPKGDTKISSIAAASVLAKVYRDRMMRRLDRRYPEYAFAKHKGYGTVLHLMKLKVHGPSPIHRRSFAPVRLSARQDPFAHVAISCIS